MNGISKKVIAGLLTLFAVVGGFFAIDSHYVTQAYFAVCDTRTKEKLVDIQEDIDMKIAGVQKEISIQRAQDEVFFWLKVEMELYKAHTDHPEDKLLQNKYLKAVQKRQEAEKKLKELQGN